MKKIRLHGKYAIGKYKYALVDNEDYDFINQWKWYPKKSNTKIYAIRNIKYRNKNITIRMHRLILGIEIQNQKNNNDVDHINRNSLDNRKFNLRVVNRSENIKNQKLYIIQFNCMVCGKQIEDIVLESTLHIKRKYCSKCSTKQNWSTVHFKECKYCNKIFTTSDNRQVFCTDICRYKFRNNKNKCIVLGP